VWKCTLKVVPVSNNKDFFLIWPTSTTWLATAVTRLLRSVRPTQDCVEVYSEGCSSFKQQRLLSHLTDVDDMVGDRCDPVIEVFTRQSAMCCQLANLRSLHLVIFLPVGLLHVPAYFLCSACSRRVTTMWVNRPPQVSQLGQLSLSSFRGRWMSSRPVYRMCAQVAPSGECLRGYKPGAVVSNRLAPRLAASCLC